MASSCVLCPPGLPMSDGALHTDENLMALLCEGHEEALAELVERYQNDVFRFCLHYLKNVELAKETAQETFLRVYTARERFDVSRRFKPWMLCIARNLCLNELKRAKRAIQMATLEEYASSARKPSGVLLPTSEDGPDQRLMAEERQQALFRALKELSDDAREIVILRYFQRMSARDIAEVVDSTEGAVRTRLHRTLKQLRMSCEPLKEDL